VIVVTVQYRLGLLGFLAHPLLTAEGQGSSGNYGLMDLIAPPEMGTQQHRRVRRRPGESDDLWRVRRIGECASAARVPRGCRAVLGRRHGELGAQGRSDRHQRRGADRRATSTVKIGDDLGFFDL
jgi:hypothetical protein